MGYSPRVAMRVCIYMCVCVCVQKIPFGTSFPFGHHRDPVEFPEL